MLQWLACRHVLENPLNSVSTTDPFIRKKEVQTLRTMGYLCPMQDNGHPQAPTEPSFAELGK